ncbi:pseudouridine synthase [Ulvibacter litoralis]|uniref:Pseudouridine synthase n=1 Tax=Ulvibacter litoralis TaxID=227084 RepID=A0A1G7FE76_9FLAO|nr:pseudouridine synthase [Ulvibacter litoralis]GHC51515.1 pseudouridine synthase [Ulvibacter litoralis]SDE74182.1 23S rRNA pseudouridine2457 synthase [Ulvibacter litoralis]
MEANNHRHFILHKPYGYISQFISNDVKSHKKKFLGELYDFPVETMSIGRLDEKSEGLLLLTTNGKLSATINSKKIEKEYYAQVDGIITSEAITLLQNGVEIGLHGKKYITKPGEARKIESPNFKARTQKIRDERHGPTSWVSITLKEGKFRQVRKMTSAVGFPTLRLVRVRVGEIQLDSLVPGEAVEVRSLLPFQH